MINRRCIRIKVFQTVYCNYKQEFKSLNEAEKHLFHSLEKTHQLYFFILMFVSDLAKQAEIHNRKQNSKYNLNVDDFVDNRNFIQNKFIELINRDKGFQSYLLKNQLSWHDHEEYLRSFAPKIASKLDDSLINAEYDNAQQAIFKKLIASKAYSNYSQLEDTTYAQDQNFIVCLLEEFILQSEIFYDLLEETNINWSDDLTTVFNILIVLVRKSKPTGMVLPEMYKDEKDDTSFAKQLLHKTIINRQKYDDIIAKHTKNWDISRLQESDTIIMRMALVELLEIPKIHANITLNEYIDISKYYNDTKSSPKFINGILNAVLQELIKAGEISKLKIQNIKKRQ